MPPRSVDPTAERVHLRPATADDVLQLAQLNNSAVPAVPLVSDAEMAELLVQANWSLVAERDGQVLGMVMCFGTGEDYSSENYRYFEQNYSSHFYIDRIVIDESARGEGLGAILYGEVFAEAARRGAQVVTCEVNLEPPNPASIAFHHRMGFEDVSTQATKGGSVVVQLMAASVTDV